MRDLRLLVWCAALATSAIGCAKAGPLDPGAGASDAADQRGDAQGSDGDDGVDAPTSCGAPAAPANGTATAPSTGIGDVAMFGCDTGFVLTGSATATCQANGAWTAGPTCALGAACSAPPPAPASGTVTAPQLASGSVASYGCIGTHLLLKGQYSTCIDGTWVGAPPQCAARIDCACSGEFVQGEAIYAPVANTGGASGLAAGTTGTVLAGNSDQGPSFQLLVQWSGWNQGHGGNCAAVDCGPCSNSGSSKWYTSCASVATPRLRCTCGGAFTEGDRVVAMTNAPSGAAGLTLGQAGTVIAGAAGKLLVQWDDFTGGDDGQCQLATCGRCTPAGNARWWVNCTEIGRAP